MSKNLIVIILAAGNGTRMKSSLPKVLHLLAGRPLLQHVINTAQKLLPSSIYIIYGNQGEKIKSSITENLNNASHADFRLDNIYWIYQEQQLGTAHAVMQALPDIAQTEKSILDQSQLLILYADVPLISAETLQGLITHTDFHQLGLLTARVKNPTGLGRIIRNADNKIIKIIEEQEADTRQKMLKEINTGIYVSSYKNFQQWLPQINNHNTQQEYYLTDMVNENRDIIARCIDNITEIQGVNTRRQLSRVERYYQKKMALYLLASGVTLIDPDRIDIRGSGKIQIEQDVILDINIILEGNINIGSGSKIGAHCIIKNTVIGKNVEIRPYCIIENAVIHNECKIGPFARIRPGTEIYDKAAVGNFTEIKNAQIGKDSKIPHLSYIGDAVIGEKVNIGAGVITCNYDGINKHQTVIGDGAFIGSDVQLIAPVIVGDNAFIGAGSTITKNAPANKLTLSRSKQMSADHWKKPEKHKEK